MWKILSGKGLGWRGCILSYELYINIVVLLVVKSRNLVWKSCSASRSGNEGWPMCRGFGAWKRHIEHPWSPPLQERKDGPPVRTTYDL
jgi:hypothetical protein